MARKKPIKIHLVHSIKGELRRNCMWISDEDHDYQIEHLKFISADQKVYETKEFPGWCAFIATNFSAS